MNAPTYKVPVLVCKMVRERSVSLAVDVADSSRAAIELARAMIGDKPQEHFLAIFTNGQCAIVGVTIVAIGQGSKLQIAPKDVFRPALACGATAVILAHNHPSGDPKPSADDLATTRHLVDAGKLVGVPIVDHVIVAGNRSFSMSDSLSVDF